MDVACVELEPRGRDIESLQAAVGWRLVSQFFVGGGGGGGGVAVSLSSVPF